MHPSPWPLGLVGSPRTPVGAGGRLWLGPPTGALCAGIRPHRPTPGQGRDLGREGPPLWGGNRKPGLWTEDSDPLDALALAPHQFTALASGGHNSGLGLGLSHSGCGDLLGHVPDRGEVLSCYLKAKLLLSAFKGGGWRLSAGRTGPHCLVGKLPGTRKGTAGGGHPGAGGPGRGGPTASPGGRFLK